MPNSALNEESLARFREALSSPRRLNSMATATKPRPALAVPRTPTIPAEQFAPWLPLLAEGYKQQNRRFGPRYPYPQLVRLTPVELDGETDAGETLVVVGRQLSEQGLDFYHPSPLPYRRVIVTLETSEGRWLRLLLDLTWCRFTRQGWYESGGRFIKILASG